MVKKYNVSLSTAHLHQKSQTLLQFLAVLQVSTKKVMKSNTFVPKARGQWGIVDHLLHLSPDVKSIILQS